MRKIILTLLLTFPLIATSQVAKEKLRKKLTEASFSESFQLGSDLMHDKIYQEALYVWELMLEKDLVNANLNYKAGLCLIKLNRAKDAQLYFEKAQYGVVKNYNPFSPLERAAPPETYYYLAASSHRNSQIDTAITQYKFFLNEAKKKHQLYSSAMIGITQCKVAKDQIENPKGYVIRNLGGQINSAAPEYSPVITIDESAIFFTSKRLRPDSSNKNVINIQNGQYYEDIYASYRATNGNWETPVLLGFCTRKDNDASISVTPDGQKVFVYKDINGGDIYYSEIEDTAFLAINIFPAAELNSEFWEPHITISSDEDVIYFVSDRPGGLGGTDIWRIRKLPNGTWSKAYNIGAPVNTAHNEDSPFLGIDSKTLYFSSDSEKSMGGFDIFVSQVDEENTWSEPENMGYPLNTVDDDIFYTTTADGRIGYYSSDKLDGFGDKDIYKVETESTFIKNVTIFSGFILTPDGSAIPDGIQIFVTDITDNENPHRYSPRKRDGGYVFALKPCHTYQAEYQLDGTIFYEDEISVPCNSSYQELHHELLLNPIDLKVTVLADLPIKTNRWEIIGSDDFQVLSGKEVSIYNEGELIYSELLNKYGQFKYRALDIKKSYLMKIKGVDGDICADLKANLVDSTSNILDTYTFKFDCTSEPTVKEFSDVLTSPIFQYNFGYNKEKFDVKNKALSVYVEGIKQVVDAGKKITIVVNSSASKVPTRKFESNYDLAKKRLNVGKQTILKSLKQNKIDISKITFIDGDALVQGPSYKNDARENENVYQRYQYIRFEIQF